MLTFRLSSLFAAITLIAIAVAYFARPEQMEVSVLFAIERPPRALRPPNVEASEIEAEFRRFLAAQPEVVTSRRVLRVAMSDPKVAALPIVKAQRDPQRLLSQRLEISFPSEELMLVKMAGRNDEVNQLLPILDAVANSYLKSASELREHNRNQARKLLQEETSRLDLDCREISAQLHRLQTKASTDEIHSSMLADLEFLQAELDRKKSMLDELARRKLILDADLRVEPTVTLWSSAAIHSRIDP